MGPPQAAGRDPVHRFGAALPASIAACCTLPSLDTPLVVIVIARAVRRRRARRLRHDPPGTDAAGRPRRDHDRVTAPPTVSLDFTQTPDAKIEDLVQPLVEVGEVISTFSVSGFGIEHHRAAS